MPSKDETRELLAMIEAALANEADLSEASNLRGAKVRVAFLSRLKSPAPADFTEALYDLYVWYTDFDIRAKDPEYHQSRKSKLEKWVNKLRLVYM